MDAVHGRSPADIHDDALVMVHDILIDMLRQRSDEYRRLYVLRGTARVSVIEMCMHVEAAIEGEVTMSTMELHRLMCKALQQY